MALKRKAEETQAKESQQPKQTQEIPELDAENMTMEEQIFTICSGIIGSEDNPAAYGVLSLIEYNNETGTIDAKELENVILNSAIFNIYHRGGAVVITIDMKKEYVMTFKQAVTLCENYLESQTQKRNDFEQLELTLTPSLLNGQIALLFRELVYMTYTQLPNERYQLALVYNNIATRAFETGIDDQAVERDIQRELDEMDRMYDTQLDNINAQISEVEKDNSYDQLFNENFVEGVLNPNIDEEDN